MLYWVVLFVLGEILSKIVSIYAVVLIGILYLIYVVKVLQRKEKKVLQFAGVIFFCLGAFCMASWGRIIDNCNMKENSKITVQGQVVTREESAKNTSYIINVNQINNENFAGKIRIVPVNEQNLILGSKVTGEGFVQLFSEAGNPGQYDEKSYWHGNGVLLAVKNVKITEKRIPIFAWREYLNIAQSYIADVYSVLFDEKKASLATAMILGDKKNLDADVKVLYQRNGIAHLIAISGLHIAMLGGSLYKLLRRLTGSYSVAAIVGMIFIILYGVMTGLSGATFRAVIMLLVSMGADVSGRKYDALTAIALALLILLIRNPYQITQVGFLLSFGAILGIVLIYPVWRMWFPKLPKFLDGLCVSLSVQIILFPVMLYFFYEIPLYSTILNIIVVPIMNILLLLLILCGGLGFFSLEIAYFPARLADVIFSFYEILCKISECIPGHTLCIGRPSLWWIMLYYILLAFAVCLSHLHRKKEICLFMLAYVILFAMMFLPTDVLICMYDVGQGDSIYIRTKYHSHILIDGGSSSERKIGNYVLKNGLKYYGANVLDYVFVSHIDYDHYNGIQELLEENLIKIKRLVLPAIMNPDNAYIELVRLAKEKGCRVYYMQKGDYLRIDDMSFTCLNPRRQIYEDKNAGSIVLQMNYKKFDMLLTGDLPEQEEQCLLSDIKGSIEVLKVAHHGSATSSCEAFLSAIYPQIACVSVGEHNQYGHPAREVMERLCDFAKKIYLTKDSGAIIIETDGDAYQIASFLE